MTHQKRLLIYSDCYIYGGSERLMSAIIRSKKLNYEFDIQMAYRTHRLYNEGLAVEYSPKELSKYFLPLPILANDTLFYHLNALKLHKILLLSIKSFFWLLQKSGVYWLWNAVPFIYLLLRVRPDVLHINNGGYPGAKSCTQLALIASFICPAKIVYQVNNMAFPPASWLDRVFDRHLSRHCQFVTGSKTSQSQLISLRNFPSTSLTQIFNTAPEELAVLTRAKFLELWSLPENTVILTEVAFLSERKGQRYLLEALFLLKSRNQKLLSNVVLFLVGDGEDEDFLKNLCKHYQLETNIRFTGYRNNSIDYIANCDLFLLPSVANEDMPLVILSAMKHEKIIIASRLSGIQEEVEEGVSGVLINPDSSTMAIELADSIQAQLTCPNSEFGKNAKLRYEALFSATAYEQSLSKLYNKL